MDEGYVGILLLAVFSITTAVIFHLRGRGFFFASLTAAISATCALLLVDTAWHGGPDKRLPLAFVVSMVPAFIVSMLVGWIMRWRTARRRKDDQEHS